jgi:hypothetical protein
MSTGYQIKDQEGLYYLTFQVVDWIDVFSRQAYPPWRKSVTCAIKLFPLALIYYKGEKG